MSRLVAPLLALTLFGAGTELRAEPRIERRGQQEIPGAWVLVFEPGQGGAAAIEALGRRGVAGARGSRLAPRLVSLRGLNERAVERLLDLPGLLRIEPETMLRLQLEESIPQIGADAASLALAGLGDLDGEGVRVCVVDSGVRASHEAFGGRVDAANGWNTADDDADTSDVHGHGTHVASTLGGNWPDGRRGAAPGVTIVPVRACDENEDCPSFAVRDAIEFCVDPDGGNADIVNLSLGGASFEGPCDDDSLAILANAAVDAGLVVVAASGNEGNDDAIDTPACGSRVLAVGAVYDDRFLTECGTPFSEVDERACFSNAGPELDVVAPGARVTAADRDSDQDLATLQGTSMATPMVSGLAALLLQRSPELSPAELGALIRNTAVDLGPAGPDPDFGHGRIDVVRALGASATCPACPDPGWGDLHPPAGDGSVELADWLVLRRFVTTASLPSPDQLLRGDLSPGSFECPDEGAPAAWCPGGNGSLTIGDLGVLRRRLGGVVAFPCAPCDPVISEAGGELRRPGDVAPEGGGDGGLDVADVLRLLRFVVGLESASGEELLRGDLAPAGEESGLRVVVGDDLLDISDVLLALNGAVGLVELTWPARSFDLTAAFPRPIAAAHVEITGWPAWAVPAGPGGACGLGGGLEAAGETWSLICAWDPQELGTGSLLGQPSYRGPEAIAPASLGVSGTAVDELLAEVLFDSFSLAP